MILLYCKNLYSFIQRFAFLVPNKVYHDPDTVTYKSSAQIINLFRISLMQNVSDSSNFKVFESMTQNVLTLISTHSSSWILLTIRWTFMTVVIISKLIVKYLWSICQRLWIYLLGNCWFNLIVFWIYINFLFYLLTNLF